MIRKRPTVADLRALKGKRQLIMLRITTLDEAEAAEKAGVDFVSLPPELVTDPRYRDVAPGLFSMTGITHLEAGTRDDYLRWALEMMRTGADAVYCSGSMETVAHAAREHVPVIGHVGLVPSRVTWTGGFKAVGKTADGAMQLWAAVKALEAAGAIGAEIEVVPVEVAEAISRRTSLIMLSMGAGAGCDAQYLFAEDILGTNRGHMPRHSKVYRNLAAEYDRIQKERVAAFSEFRADVEAGAYPEEKHILRMEKAELADFLRRLG